MKVSFHRYMMKERYTKKGFEVSVNFCQASDECPFDFATLEIGGDDETLDLYFADLESVAIFGELITSKAKTLIAGKEETESNTQAEAFLDRLPEAGKEKSEAEG